MRKYGIYIYTHFTHVSTYFKKNIIITKSTTFLYVTYGDSQSPTYVVVSPIFHALECIYSKNFLEFSTLLYFFTFYIQFAQSDQEIP